MSDEYKVRCEIMALWSGQGKTIARIRTTQMRAFLALKAYRAFKKHSKNVLEHKLRKFKLAKARTIFQGWNKAHQEYKAES